MTAETDARETKRPHWETGARLARARTDLGLGQSEMAEMIGVSQAALSHYERGRRLPSTEALAALVALSVDIAWVLTGTSDLVEDSEAGERAKRAKANVGFIVPRNGRDLLREVFLRRHRWDPSEEGDANAWLEDLEADVRAALSSSPDLGNGDWSGDADLIDRSLVALHGALRDGAYDTEDDVTLAGARAALQRLVTTPAPAPSPSAVPSGDGRVGTGYDLEIVGVGTDAPTIQIRHALLGLVEVKLSRGQADAMSALLSASRFPMPEKLRFAYRSGERRPWVLEERGPDGWRFYARCGEALDEQQRAVDMWAEGRKALDDAFGKTGAKENSDV